MTSCSCLHPSSFRRLTIHLLFYNPQTGFLSPHLPYHSPPRIRVVFLSKKWRFHRDFFAFLLTKWPAPSGVWKMFFSGLNGTFERVNIYENWPCENKTLTFFNKVLSFFYETSQNFHKVLTFFIEFSSIFHQIFTNSAVISRKTPHNRQYRTGILAFFTPSKFAQNRPKGCMMKNIRFSRHYDLITAVNQPINR